MIYVPDPVELEVEHIQLGDILTMTLPFKQYQVYYIGAYPPPHFEDEGYEVVEEEIGKPILGLFDTAGNGFWLGQAEAYDNREMFRTP